MAVPCQAQRLLEKPTGDAADGDAAASDDATAADAATDSGQRNDLGRETVVLDQRTLIQVLLVKYRWLF